MERNSKHQIPNSKDQFWNLVLGIWNFPFMELTSPPHSRKPLSLLYFPPMIAHLRGTVHRMDPGEVTVDVAGVGYKVGVPLDVWDQLEEGQQRMLWITSYIREDRFDLFGFPDRAGKTLFDEFLKLPGVGPKLALELCAVPRSLLSQAVRDDDPALLSTIKGVGRKTGEKLLVELKSLGEKRPEIFATPAGTPARSEFDQDAIAALTALGYDSQTALSALKDLPPTLQSTEERVAAALRSL
jgi:holliday junction DNA helicase RuvA